VVVTGAQDVRADRRAPVVRRGVGECDPGEHGVDDSVKEGVLVRDVVVERHRLDAEFLRMDAVTT
jgi:hypothetical protein